MKTDITIILDRSGSMNKIAADTIGGVNKFITDQQTAPGEATFTLVQFNHGYEVTHDAVPINRVELLTDKTFVPSGNTALLDAVGRTIDATGRRFAAMNKSARPDKIVCVIVTDGEENASRTFSRSQIFDKITHQRDVYNWEFVFLGANQDAFAEAAKIGIYRDNTLWYDVNRVAETFKTLSVNTSNLRGGASATMAWSDEDRKKVKDADKA